MSKLFERLNRLSKAYKRVFETDGGEQVLADLAAFCGAKKSVFNTDALEMARAEGRREVWLRIQAQLNLNEAYLYNVVNKMNEEIQ